MKARTRKIRDDVPLQFRHVGSGFIVAKTDEGISLGRKLAPTYCDQYDRKYVQINGAMELVTDTHCYLGVD